MKSQYDDSIRFNWGFWDAVDDRGRGRPPRSMAGHFDIAYARGYRAGWGDYDLPMPKVEAVQWEA